jgi:formylmethanofuran dehydrogenase subunit D
MHPDELSRLGTSAGAPVQVTSPRGTVTLIASADAGVPAGTVWLPAGEAADLIDAAKPTFVSVEVGVGG